MGDAVTSKETIGEGAKVFTDVVSSTFSLSLVLVYTTGVVRRSVSGNQTTAGTHGADSRAVWAKLKIERNREAGYQASTAEMGTRERLGWALEDT